MLPRLLLFAINENWKIIIPREKNENIQEKNENIINSENYTFSNEIWIVTISENWITNKIKLTPTERLLVNQNPKTLKNIINFYKTLDIIWLSKLWWIKENLFKVIWNKKWIWFKIDNDYLNENEIKIFLNSILKSVWEDEISPVFTLNSFLFKIEQKNKNQIWWDEAIVNTNLNETFLENKFFNKFVPRYSTISNLNISQFWEAL
jgi:hypothetical protein